MCGELIMDIIVSLSTVDILKRILGQALPEVKSSHRAEAMARGLGWGTNAAMRAALAGAPANQTIEPVAFTDYLAKRDFIANERVFPNAVLSAQIWAVREANPELSRYGFGVYEENRISVMEWRKRKAESRAEMLGAQAIAEFERACEFLLQLQKTQAPTRVLTSYKLKHSAERWHRHRGIEGRWDRDYVSNGMLLTAAYHLGFQVRRTSRTSFSGYLNVSTASVRAIEEQRKMPLPQPEDGDPFRVLGHDHGKFHYLRAGTNLPITLSAGAHTPKRLLRLAPIDYWVSRFPTRDRRAPFNTMAVIDHLFRLAHTAGIFVR